MLWKFFRGVWAGFLFVFVVWVFVFGIGLRSVLSWLRALSMLLKGTFNVGKSDVCLCCMGLCGKRI